MTDGTSRHVARRLALACVGAVIIALLAFDVSDGVLHFAGRRIVRSARPALFWLEAAAIAAVALAILFLAVSGVGYARSTPPKER